MNFEISDLPKSLQAQARAKLGLIDKKPVEATPRTNKYNATPTTRQGIKFSSKSEAKRFDDLKLLEQSGEIQNLELQPSFQIIKSQTHSGKKYRGAKYTADFKYIENGKVVIEEFKGFRDKTYILRLKMFLEKHPDIIFKETKS